MIIGPCRRQFPRLPLLSLLVFLCCGNLAAQPVPPAAAQGDAFTVPGVHVDATGATTSAAREAARIDGQRRALDTLWGRLTAAADRSRLPKLSDTQITDLVHDFEVANERSSAVRYFGDYTFRFRKNEIRRLLKTADIAFAETVSKPVMVVPLLRIADRALLWDAPDASPNGGPNGWKQAWKDALAARSGGLVQLTVPPGDAGDAAALTAEQAQAGDLPALTAFATRYGTGEILVAQASLANKDAPQIDTAITRYADGQLIRRIDASYRLAAGESVAQMTARAATASIAAIEDAWKQDNQLRYGQETTLTVSVPITSLADWVALRTRLAGITPIRRGTLLTLGKSEAVVEFHYLGEADRLRTALTQGGFILTDATPNPVLTSRAANPGVP